MQIGQYEERGNDNPYKDVGERFRSDKKEGEEGGELPLPLPFQNLDAALDEEIIRVDRISYYVDVATGEEFRQSPIKRILRVIF